MPGTFAEDIEIIDAGHGGGTGTPAGGDDDSGSSGSRRPVPRRAYFTALQLGLAAIVMFFMALASSYIVRKGPGQRLAAHADASGSVVQHGDSAGQQRHHYCGAKETGKRRARSVSNVVVGDHWPWRALSGWANYCLASTCRRWNASFHQSQQQLFLCFDGGARRASGRRNFCLVLRHVPAVEAFAHLADNSCGTNFNLLAFYGRAVGVLARTSDSGTVNRA